MSLENRDILERLTSNFGIELSQEEASTIETPGQLAALISRKLSEVDVRVCSQQRAFNLLRKCLVKEFDVPYDEVQLNSNIVKLTNQKDQKALWETLKTCTRTTYWPRLKLPFLFHYLVRLTDVALYAYFILQMESIGAYVGAFFWALFPVLIFHTLVYKTTKQFRNRIDPEFKTAKKLLPAIQTSKMYVWSQSEIENDIKEILLEFGKGDEESYTLEMKLS